jgi:UDP-glucose 4-epimerase
VPSTEPVVVTGAGGYLGGRVVEHLACAGERRVLASSRRPAPWLPAPVEVMDLTDQRASVADLVAGASAVVHLAGSNETHAADDPDQALADTVAAARRVVEACEAAAVSRVIYVSTVHVYGDALAPGATVTEDARPEPRSAYAAARFEVELLMGAAAVDAVVLRLTNGVGRPVAPQVDRWSLVANDLCRQAAAVGRLRLRTDGMQWRDFIALADVCRVVAAAVEPALVTAGTYNLGSGKPLTIRDLAELVKDAAEAATGLRPPLLSPAPSAPPDRPYLVATERLDALGLTATVPLEAAIDETLRFCLEHEVAA